MKFSLPNRWFPPNAISRAELAYLGRQPKSRRWWRILLQALEWVMLTVGMILFGGEFIGALLQRDPAPITYHMSAIAVAFIGYVLVRHFGLLLQTLSLSANSIAREKQAMNWDMLVLTGIDGRQIVYGKWLAVVQRQFPAYVRLGLLRAMALVFWNAYLSRVSFTSFYTYYSSSLVSVIPPLPLQILLAAGLIFLLTLANLFFTAACGVMASAQFKRPVGALVSAVISRPLVLIGFIFVFSLLSRVLNVAFTPFPNSTTFWISSALVLALITLLDNGGNLVWSLVATQYLLQSGYSINGFYGNSLDQNVLVTAITLLVIGFYLLLTGLLLRVARRRTLSAGALPPLSQKSKRKIAV